MLCTINWANWIQAISALCVVGLTIATLWVLWGYAADTKIIAKVTASQTENSQMPFLALVRRPAHEQWHIQNQGFGPALNIRYTGDNQGNAIAMRSTEPLSAGEPREMHNQISAAFTRWQLFEMEYQSLSGSYYVTTVRLENDQTFTEFRKGRLQR